MLVNVLHGCDAPHCASLCYDAVSVPRHPRPTLARKNASALHYHHLHRNIAASKVILLFDPLIMHISDFVSESERKHLLEAEYVPLTPL
jgi:hypothetical protein